MKTNIGIFYMVITACLWSLGGLLIKVIPLSPMALISARSICALFIFIPFFIHTNKKEIHRISFKGAYLKHYFICSIFIASLSIFFVVATKLTTAAHAIILQFTAPIWIILIGLLFFKIKPKAKDVKAIVLVLIGIIIFLSNGLTGSHQIGNMIAILSGISMAIMILYFKSNHIEFPLLAVIFANIINALIGLPFLLNSSLDVTTLMYILMIGIFQYGISYIFYTKAVLSLESLQIVIISALEPILNPLWVFLILGETLSVRSMVGGALVLLVIIKYNIDKSLERKIGSEIYLEKNTA